MLAWQELDLREDPDEARFVGDPAELLDARVLLTELIDRPAWMADALCREHPGVTFFLERGEDARPAKAICSSCLVRDECLAYAIDQGSALHGIWGGASDRERRRMRKSTTVDTAA